MKYLFLDVEGHQGNNKLSISEEDILEISAICVDKDFKNEKSFFSMVKPKHMDAVNDRTLSLLRLDRKVLEDALTIEVVMEKFIKTFSKFEVIVVWNRYTYDLFLKAATHNGIKVPDFRVVVIQELLSVIDKPVLGEVIEFEKAIIRYHVNFNPKLLHFAKHNVDCLKKLYCSVKFQYKYQCKVEQINEVVMLNNSIVIHSSKCHYVSEDNVIKKAKETDVFYGYPMCKHCINAGNYTTMPENLVFEKLDDMEEYSEEKVAKICERFNMDYKFSDSVLFVRTKMSSWRIYHDGIKITNIYHENYRKSKSEIGKRKKKCNEGFHRQDIKCNNFYEALSYIHSHDKYFLNANQNKQGRIDMLFAMVEKERQEKEVEIEPFLQEASN